MSDRFTEALRHLGHIYEPRPEGFAVEEENVRHVTKVFVPTGEIKPICGTPNPASGLGCPALWLDSNCERCKEIEGGLAPALTKRSLMLDLVNGMCDIEQMFLDAMYWNFHNPDKEAVNPDPDGDLAKTWLEYEMQITSMMARFKPTMEKHEGRFGWPTDLEFPDEKHVGT